MECKTTWHNHFFNHECYCLFFPHGIRTSITVTSKNEGESTKSFSPTKAATAADSMRHCSGRHCCKSRDATWQSLMRAENGTSVTKFHKGTKPSAASTGSSWSTKEETWNPSMVSLGWHLHSPSPNIWRNVLVLPLPLYFPLSCLIG